MEDVSNHLSPCTGAATVTVSNTFVDLVVDGGFESGGASWSSGLGCIRAANGTFPAHGGANLARIESSTASCATYQTIAIPATAGSAHLRFWLDVVTNETGFTAVDTFAVTVRNTSGAVLGTLATFSNLDSKYYTERVYDLSAYRGQTVRIHFADQPSFSYPTYFLLDDVRLLVTTPP